MEIVSLQRTNPDTLLLSPMFFDLVLVMIAVIMVMVISMIMVIMVMAIETTMMLASCISKIIQPGWNWPRALPCLPVHHHHPPPSKS